MLVHRVVHRRRDDAAGAGTASAAVVSRLSAWPARELGERVGRRGRDRRRRRRRATSSRCESGACAGGGSPGNAPRSGSRSHSVTSTGAPVMPANDAAPTKRCDASVWMTRTAWPAFVARRVELERLVGGDAAGDAEEDARHAPRRALYAVAVLDLALGDFLEGDREVVLRARVDHRRRELLERALAEVVVVRVDLARALGGDDHARVVASRRCSSRRSTRGEIKWQSVLGREGS